MIRELDIKQKRPLGAGAFHDVFPYKAFDNKVIKTRKGTVKFTMNGKAELSDREPMNLNDMKIFSEHPQFFAHVFKFNERYAVIEKLDVEAFKKDELIVAQGIFKFCIEKPMMISTVLPYTFNPKMQDVTDIDVMKILYFLVGKDRADVRVQILGKYCYNSKKIDEWYKFMVDLDHTFGKRAIDVHDANFGYNKEKKLKLLDI